MSDESRPVARIEAPWGKWSIVIGYWLAQAAAVYLLSPALVCDFDLQSMAEAYRESEYNLWMSLAIAGITSLQAVLLVPIRRPGLRPSGSARWVVPVIGGVALGLTAGYLAMLAAALLSETRVLPMKDQTIFNIGLATALTVSLATGTWLFFAYRGAMPAIVSLGIMALAAAHLVLAAVLIGIDLLDHYAKVAPPEKAWPFLVFGILLVSWSVGTVLLFGFCRRRGPDDALARISARLFLGTLVEAAAIIPLDVMVRRRTNCYCEEATFFSLTICWAVGTLVLGPAVWLVPLAKRRRRWQGGCCDSCGYDMSGCIQADRCPECGAGWRGG